MGLAALVAKQREHAREEKSRCDPYISFRVSFDAGNVASAFIIVASEESSQDLVHQCKTAVDFTICRYAGRQAGSQ